MKHFLFRLVCLTAGLCSLNSYAAALRLNFAGQNSDSATVTINGKEYDINKTRNSVPVDTGFNDISKIQWVERTETPEQNGFGIVETTYEAPLPNTVSFFNISGLFTIGDNGTYTYFFSPTNRQDTPQNARKVSGPNKVY